jgi:hypothetical protein
MHWERLQETGKFLARLAKSVPGVKEIDESDRVSWNSFHTARRKRH